MHPRQVAQSAGFEGAAWVRWSSFSVYGVKLHLLCATNGVPISYELTPLQNVAEVRLTEKMLAEANLGDDLAHSSFLPAAGNRLVRPSLAATTPPIRTTLKTYRVARTG